MLESLKHLLFGPVQSNVEGEVATSRPDVPVRSPIFIIGCGRSGTTLLFQLMKAHQGLAPTTGFPDGEDHVGWIRHGDAIIAGLATPAGDSGHVGYNCCLHMDAADVTQEARAGMHKYYANEVLCGNPDLRVINKCPHLSNKLLYVLEIFPDARFIQIVRDPVAVVASWVKVMEAYPDLTLYWPKTEFPCLWVLPVSAAGHRACVTRDPQLFPGGGLLRLADYWAEVNRNIPTQLVNNADKLLTIRYEDLVADPVKLLRQVTDYCGLDPFADVPVEIEPDRNLAWSGLVGEEDIHAIRQRCTEVAEFFGYPAHTVER